MNVGQRMGRYFWSRRSDRGGQGERPAPLEEAGMAADESSETGVAGAEEDLESFDIAGIEKGEETMDEERMQILKMVEEHKITAEEGAKLMAALDAGTKPSERVTGRPPKWIRIRVTDMATGRSKVNVNVPVGVITAVSKLGEKFGLSKYMEKEGVDIDQLFDMIQSGTEGKLVDVIDSEEREHVEVYVE